MTSTALYRRALVNALTAPRINAVGWSSDVVAGAVRDATQSSEIARLAYLAERATPESALAEAAQRAAGPARLLAGWQASLTVEVMQHFARANIAARVFKGAPLAAWLHGDATVRNSCDIDVLVAPQDVFPAIALLQADGWQLPFQLSVEHFDDRLLRRYREVPLSNLGGTFSVDLHWRLTSDWNERVINEPDLLAESHETVVVAGRALPWFAPADVWCLALSHVVTSDWHGLKAWVDMVLVGDRLCENDWAQVAARLDANAATGAHAVAACAARVLSQVFGRTLPSPVASPALPRRVARRVERVATIAANRLLLDGHTHDATAEQGAMSLLKGTAIGRDTFLSRATAVAVRLSTPALDDLIDGRGHKRSGTSARVAMAARRMRSYGG